MNSNTPAVPDSTVSAVDVLDYFATGRTLPIVVEDPAVVAARIDAEILNASSVEELFGERSVIHARDYLNRPFRLLDVEWRPSTFDEEGLPFFAVLHIVTTDGEPAVMTTGARSVMLKAAKASSAGWLPLSVRLVQAEKATDNGYRPLDLVAAPDGF